jgi:hypothetical protein
MDGGTVWDVNIGSAVQQCMELVDDYSQIVIDIAVCSYDIMPKYESVSYNAWENFLAARAIKNYWQSTNNVEKEMRAYPGINYRYYF